MTYEEMQKKVSKLLDETENKMNDLIETYNENNEDESEIDTVDLSAKFSDLQDYIEEYTN